MKYITLLGFVAASLTTFSMLPQVLKTIRTKETKDLSLIMFFMATVGFAIWIIYGFYRANIVLISANIITFSLGLTLVVLKLRHG